MQPAITNNNRIDLPKSLYDRTIGRYKWQAVELGVSRSWICIAKHKQNGFSILSKSLSIMYCSELRNTASDGFAKHYPDIETKLRDKLKTWKVEAIRITLGAAGCWTLVDISTGALSWTKQLATSGLTTELLHGLASATCIALGLDGAWAIVESDGSVIWELRGHYKGLEKRLSEDKHVVKVDQTPTHDARRD